jgi:hypothetical protein
MKSTKHLLIVACATLIGLGAEAQTPASTETPQKIVPSGIRDPFWPVGFYLNAVTPAAPNKKGLTEEGLRALALAEQERLKRMLVTQGVMSSGGKNIAIISGTMVTTGDTLEVKVGGNTYKLLIKSLTPDNIQLEPVRD